MIGWPGFSTARFQHFITISCWNVVFNGWNVRVRETADWHTLSLSHHMRLLDTFYFWSGILSGHFISCYFLTRIFWCSPTNWISLRYDIFIYLYGHFIHEFILNPSSLAPFYFHLLPPSRVLAPPPSFHLQSVPSRLAWPCDGRAWPVCWQVWGAQSDAWLSPNAKLLWVRFYPYLPEASNWRLHLFVTSSFH